MFCRLLLLVLVGFNGLASAHEGAVKPLTAADLPLVEHLRAPQVPPPLPSGTSSLRFAQFFHSPAGPRGLEPSIAIVELDGRRVRLFG